MAFSVSKRYSPDHARFDLMASRMEAGYSGAIVAMNLLLPEGDRLNVDALGE